MTTRVVVTNDDGVAAPGIRWLAAAARSAGLDVVVAAPEREASGMSAALSAVTEEGRVVLTRHSLKGLDDVPAFGVSASPSYIAVLAALGAFGDPPELLLSGINRGANAGHAVLHSGTVGAALTAANHGMRALAASLDVLSAERGSSASGGAAIAALDSFDDERRHWSTAADLVERLLPWLMGATPGTVLNLNVPDTARLKGVREATLAPFGQVQMALAESGNDFVRTTVEEGADERVEGSDLAWLAAGYATVTPLRPPAHDPSVRVPLDD
jgi:5'-nucleotidase